jgi:hypothetical protein
LTIPFHHPSIRPIFAVQTRTLLHFPRQACDIIHYSTAHSSSRQQQQQQQQHHLLSPRQPPASSRNLLVSSATVSLALRPLRSQSRKPTPLHAPTLPPIDVPSPPALHRIALLHRSTTTTTTTTIIIASAAVALPLLCSSLSSACFHSQTASFLPVNFRL